MLGILTFILVFGIIVVVHEFGHFYFAKKSGILVREFAIGMGPKIFAHIGKDGTAYTIRILPLGGYVRMAGWGDDTTEIKTGTPVSLMLTDDGKVKRINLSGKKLDQNGPSYAGDPVLTLKTSSLSKGWFWKKKKLLQWITMQRLWKQMEQKFGLHL